MDLFHRSGFPGRRGGDSRICDRLLVPRQRRDDGPERRVGKLSHLVIRAILDRMRHEDMPRVRSERPSLHRYCTLKRCRRHHDGRDVPLFEACEVVHTARRARTSVGERLDQSSTLGVDLAP